jgi:hypothetical protein
MSWFNRKPRPKNPPANFSPKHVSPATQRKLEETKQTVRGTKNDK